KLHRFSQQDCIHMVREFLESIDSLQLHNFFGRFECPEAVLLMSNEPILIREVELGSNVELSGIDEKFFNFIENDLDFVLIFSGSTALVMTIIFMP
ncbi:hypothetical protein PMAYCL1PPCAC_24836, partial [Pristionchus mayeri]